MAATDEMALPNTVLSSGRSTTGTSPSVAVPARWRWCCRHKPDRAAAANSSPLQRETSDTAAERDGSMMIVIVEYLANRPDGRTGEADQFFPDATVADRPVDLTGVG